MSAKSIGNEKIIKSKNVPVFGSAWTVRQGNIEEGAVQAVLSSLVCKSESWRRTLCEIPIEKWVSTAVDMHCLREFPEQKMSASQKVAREKARLRLEAKRTQEKV